MRTRRATVERMYIYLARDDSIQEAVDRYTAKGWIVAGQRHARERKTARHWFVIILEKTSPII